MGRQLPLFMKPVLGGVYDIPVVTYLWTSKTLVCIPVGNRGKIGCSESMQFKISLKNWSGTYNVSYCKQ